MEPIQLTKLLTGVAIGSLFLSSGFVGIQNGRDLVGELVGIVQASKDLVAVQVQAAKQFVTPWSSHRNSLDAPLLPRSLLEQIAEATVEFRETAASLDLATENTKQLQILLRPYKTKYAEIEQGSALLWNQIQATDGFFYKPRLWTLQDRVQEKELKPQGFLSRIFPQGPLFTEKQWLAQEEFKRNTYILQGRLQRFTTGDPASLLQEYIGSMRGTIVPLEESDPVSGDSDRILELRALLAIVSRIQQEYYDSDTVLGLQLQVEGGTYRFQGSVQGDLAQIDKALPAYALPAPIYPYIRFSLYKLPLQIRIQSATKELESIRRSNLHERLVQHEQTRLQGFQEQREFARHFLSGPLITEFEDVLERLEEESLVLPRGDLDLVQNWIRAKPPLGTLRELRRFVRIAQAKRNVSWPTLILLGSLFMLFSTGFTAVLFTTIYLIIQIMFSIGQTLLNIVKVGEGATGYLAKKAGSLQLEDISTSVTKRRSGSVYR